MSKEMIISSSRHETKIALLEEGQVVEIYYEREKEVGLVGSIYKGRVTRVLPGMQSAFVNVGLDRDAFLYVSDFSGHLEGTDHAPTHSEEPAPENEKGPTPRRRRRRRSSRREKREEPAASSDAESKAAPPEDTAEVADNDSPLPTAETPAPEEQPPDTESTGENGKSSTGKEVVAAEEPELTTPERRPERRGRGRSRRRGGRGRRGGRDRAARGTADGPPEQEKPAAIGPMILPGESIAKYRDLSAKTAATETAVVEPVTEPVGPDTTSPEEPASESSSIPPEKADTTEESPSLENSPSAEVAVTSESPSDREPLVEHPADAPVAAEPEETPDETAEPEEAETTDSDDESGSDETLLMQAESEPEEDEDTPDSGEDADDEPEPEDSGEDSEENSIAEFPTEAISSDTRDELDDTLAQIQRFRRYEDEVGLPPSVEERTDEGVEWQEGDEEEEGGAEGESETGEAPEEEGEEEAAEETEEKPSEPVQAETTARQPRRGRRPIRRDRRPRGRRPYRAGRPPTGFRRRTSARPSQGQPAIAELLKAGQQIIIQIAKAQIGQKGARITSHVTLPGRYLVYMPTIDHIGVSRKIGTADERARLRQTLLRMKGDAAGGFVVRTAAAGCTEDELQTDVNYLVRLWRDILAQAEKQNSPALLHQDLDLVERLLRDQLSRSYDHVWIDNQEEYTRVVEFVGKFLPKLSNKVKLYTRDDDIFEEMGVQQEIDRALRPKVWLKSGGYIVINQTEALVAIDINTGKFVGKGSTRLEDTIVKTNLEALQEIVRQIRLRDLGGIIVIDFIDMEDRRNRYKVMRALEQALQIDRQPSKILAFNEFGLVAITRKRSKQSLERVLCQPCQYCTGTGMLKSAQTICIDIQYEARKMAMEMDAPELTIRANPEIVTALKSEASGLVRELEEEFDKNIILQPDESLHFERYNIF